MPPSSYSRLITLVTVTSMLCVISVITLGLKKGGSLAADMIRHYGKPSPPASRTVPPLSTDSDRGVGQEMSGHPTNTTSGAVSGGTRGGGTGGDTGTGPLYRLSEEDIQREEARAKIIREGDRQR